MRANLCINNPKPQKSGLLYQDGVCETDGGKVNVRQQGMPWQPDTSSEAASVKIMFFTFPARCQMQRTVRERERERRSYRKRCREQTLRQRASTGKKHQNKVFVAERCTELHGDARSQYWPLKIRHLLGGVVHLWEVQHNAVCFIAYLSYLLYNWSVLDLLSSGGLKLKSILIRFCTSMQEYIVSNFLSYCFKIHTHGFSGEFLCHMV